MILNVSLSSNLALAADKASPEMGDDATFIPSAIYPIDKILAPTGIKPQSLGTRPQTSFLTDFAVNRAASTGGTADTLVVLPRGLWTITWNLTAKFQAALAFGVAPAIELVGSFPNLGISQRIAAMFRSPSGSANTWMTGSFRLLNKDEFALRLDIGATGVSDAIDAFIGLQVEKNI